MGGKPTLNALLAEGRDNRVRRRRQERNGLGDYRTVFAPDAKLKIKGTPHDLETGNMRSLYSFAVEPQTLLIDADGASPSVESGPSLRPSDKDPAQGAAKEKERRSSVPAAACNCRKIGGDTMHPHRANFVGVDAECDKREEETSEAPEKVRPSDAKLH